MEITYQNKSVSKQRKLSKYDIHKLSISKYDWKKLYKVTVLQIFVCSKR